MSAFVDPIHVDNLKQLQKALKAAEDASPTALRHALNDAAQIVVNVARPRIPRLTGRAAGTLKVASTQTKAQIKVGGDKAPYYPWLDFGGSTGRGHVARRAGTGSVHRPFIKGGRYIYPAFEQEHANVVKLLTKRITAVIEGAGISVDG